MSGETPKYFDILLSSSPIDKPVSETIKKSKIHHFYRHGDLELRSTEGTIFRVYSAQLADSSSVFSGMIEIGNANSPTGPKRKHNIPSEPLEMDITSKILEHFLEMMPMMNPRTPPLSYLEAIKLYEFCLKFDIVDRITESIRAEVCAKACKENSWKSLIWSGEEGDISLAKEALKRMTTPAWINPPEPSNRSKSSVRPSFKTFLKKLPASWQLQLIHLNLQSPSPELSVKQPLSTFPISKAKNKASTSPPSSQPIYCMEFTHNWTRVAELFDPKFE